MVLMFLTTLAFWALDTKSKNSKHTNMNFQILFANRMLSNKTS